MGRVVLRGVMDHYEGDGAGQDPTKKLELMHTAWQKAPGPRNTKG